MRPAQTVFRTSARFCTTCRGRVVRRRVTGAELRWLRCLTQSARSGSATATAAQENNGNEGSDVWRPTNPSKVHHGGDHLGQSVLADRDLSARDSFLSSWGSGTDARARLTRQREIREKGSGLKSDKLSQNDTRKQAGMNRKRSLLGRQEAKSLSVSFGNQHSKSHRQQTHGQQMSKPASSMSLNDFEAELGRTLPSISSVSTSSAQVSIGPQAVDPQALDELIFDLPRPFKESPESPVPRKEPLTPGYDVEHIDPMQRTDSVMPLKNEVSEKTAKSGISDTLKPISAQSERIHEFKALASEDILSKDAKPKAPSSGSNLPTKTLKKENSKPQNITVTIGPAFSASAGSASSNPSAPTSRSPRRPTFSDRSGSATTKTSQSPIPSIAKRMSVSDFEQELQSGKKAPAKQPTARKQKAASPTDNSVASFLSMFDNPNTDVTSAKPTGESVSVSTMSNTFAAVESRRKSLANAQGEEFWSMLSESRNGFARPRPRRDTTKPYDPSRNRQVGALFGNSRPPYDSQKTAPTFMSSVPSVTPTQLYTDSELSKRSRKGKNDRDRRGREFIYEDEEVAPVRKTESKKEKAARKAAAAPTPILIPEFISVENLAQSLRLGTEPFRAKMQEMGFEDTSLDHILDSETAGLIALEFNFEPMVEEASADLIAQPRSEDTSAFPSRPPVVTIMGHVDHGKTTLLDYLRKSSIAASEHGGITQHIGAFSVPLASGKTITFLDTPGHEAFLSMRQRGANVTDIVVLVVAADDSVKPQTIEAIKHAQAAQVPMIVAISKIDKEDSNIEKVKQDLARHDVQIEDYGGETQVISVSGKTGKGMDELEEAIITLSEIQDMRADDSGLVEGWVLETAMKGRGKVATVLVRRGTLTVGDILVAGTTFARVRTIFNEAGDELGFASPGTAVEIDGWREQPNAGDEVLQANDEGHAKDVVDYRSWKLEIASLATDMEAINVARRQQQLERRAESENRKIETPSEPEGPKLVKFILRGDVDGSIEAVSAVVTSIGNDQVKPSILKAAVGPVSESDIYHAAAASASIITFNRAPDPQIIQAAAMQGVPLISESIIYRVIEEVKSELSKHLPPIITQRVIGEAEIAQIFKYRLAAGKTLPIAGCKVRNGVILKNQKARVMRRGETIYDGTIESLKNVKKDVTEMRKGSDCGMGFGGWEGFRAGDVVQCYEEKSDPQTL